MAVAGERKPDRVDTVLVLAHHPFKHPLYAFHHYPKHIVGLTGCIFVAIRIDLTS